MTMRALSYLPIVAMVAACAPDNIVVVPTNVEWMEWPAEVTAATPFTVRLLVPWPYCYQGEAPLNPGTSTNELTVTFEPYFLLSRHRNAPRPGAACQYHSPVDTVGTVVGLAASVPRAFGVRAASHVVSHTTPAVTLAVQTFGDVTVRQSAPDTTRRNAAGFATKELDNLGCVRLRPSVTLGVGPFDLGPRYVLDDQADKTTFWGTFVHGYIYEAAAPVCGETKVFHLVARF